MALFGLIYLGAIVFGIFIIVLLAVFLYKGIQAFDIYIEKNRRHI